MPPKGKLEEIEASLIPCHFCTHPDIIIAFEGDRVYAECCFCEARGPWSFQDSDNATQVAADDWNRKGTQCKRYKHKKELM